MTINISANPSHYFGRLGISAAILVSLALLTLSPFAKGDLAEAATNPVSNLIQARFQNSTASSYNADDEANTTSFQAVVPLPSIADNFESLQGIVTRTTASYVNTAKFDNVGRGSGIGDTNILTFAVPKAAPEKTVWGFGPSLTVPTAGDNELVGQGQWQAGPAFVVMVTPVKGLQVGSLLFHQWDFASTRSDAAYVNQSFIQPILTKHFSGGWYVGLPDTPQLYDHRTSDWTLALGAQVGKVTKWGNQPMQLFAEVFHNTEDNDVPAPKTTFKFQIGFLFPK